jgi:3-oxoacyl-[acyl-carrier-protein] synthase II
MAVADSGLNLEDFGYISTRDLHAYNDFVEVLAVELLFERPRAGRRYRARSLDGHLWSGSAVETIFTALALYHGILPATLNFGRADDPDNPNARYCCDPSMDYVPNEARARTVRAALCNAFGFGGANACVALARWDG